MRYEKPTLKLGIAPTRRDLWNNKETNDNYQKILERTKEIAKESGIELVTLEELDFSAKRFTLGGRTIEMPADQYLTDYEDACVAAEYFKEKGVQALFLAFCNFGQEEAAAKLASELKVPVLLWGPRDQKPDGVKVGMRPTDTQCGLFAASKVLKRYGVTFTYVENCWIEDRLWEEELRKFICTAQVVTAFKNLRIAQISVRPQQFMSVMVNEAELLEKFGIELVPITGAVFVGTIKRIMQENQKEIDELVADIEKTIDMSRLKDKRVVAALELGIMEVAKKYQCNAVACDCWYTIRAAFGIAPCFVFGDLYDRGLPCACEMDIHAAITSVMAMAAAGYSRPAFTADLTLRHPENENAELLWHCGPFAKSLKRDGVDGYIVEEGQGFYPLKTGKLTVLRFDGRDGEYRCFAGEGESIDGPETGGNYVWLEVDNWPKWEKKFICGPYIHHVIGIFGAYADVIKDACRYLGISYDTPDTPEK